MLSGMPRRLAESPRLWISIALAAGGAATAFALGREPPPPAPPEPDIVYCAIPEAVPRCPDARPHEMDTESGIHILTLHDGCGTSSPAADDIVEVRFTGWNLRAERIQAVETASFPLNALIPGFAEVVRGMRAGDKVQAWIPGELAYDSSPDPKLRGTLQFEIELLSFHPPRR